MQRKKKKLLQIFMKRSFCCIQFTDWISKEKMKSKRKNSSEKNESRPFNCILDDYIFILSILYLKWKNKYLTCYLCCIYGSSMPWQMYGISWVCRISAIALLYFSLFVFFALIPILLSLFLSPSVTISHFLTLSRSLKAHIMRFIVARFFVKLFALIMNCYS